MDNNQQASSNLRYQIGPGDLQWLIFYLLYRLDFKWKDLAHIVEGANKTRKGTPDIWGRLGNGRIAYLQITADASAGKMFADVEKSVKKLVKLEENQNALCISFLTYEPQPEEVLKCITLCNENGIEFSMYNNTKIIKYLARPENQDLRKTYLHIPMDSEKSIGSLERLHVAFRQLDFSSAKEQLVTIQEMLDINSNYSVKPDLASPGRFTITPKQSELNTDGTIKARITFAMTDEIKQFGDFNSLLKHSYFKQTPIELQVTEMEQKLGNQILYHNTYQTDAEEFAIVEFITDQPMELTVEDATAASGQNSGSTNTITILPPPLPEPFIVDLEIGGDSKGRLSLQTKEIEETAETVTFHISNSQQYDPPFLYKMVLKFKKRSQKSEKPSSCDFQILPKENASPYQLSNVYKVLADLSKAKELALIEVNHGTEFVSGRVSLDGSLTHFLSEHEFWKDVLYVERKFGLKFEVPKQIERAELDQMYELIQIVKTGITPIGAGTLTITFNKEETSYTQIDRIIDTNKNGNVAFKMTAEDHYSLEVFGQRLEFENRLIIITEFEKKSHKVIDDDHSNTLIFKSAAKNILIIYPEFYGTDDMLEILTAERVNEVINATIADNE